MPTLTSVVNYQALFLRGRSRKNSQTALRAVTGARLCASGQADNAAVAAACVGSTSAYVRAAVTLLRSEDEHLLDRVLRGELHLLEAAKSVRRVARLIDAYRGASEQDLIRATKIVGRVFVPTAVAAE
jgi:Arc/MetJ-type ribon-helix-helix transcriptional regulator